MSRKTVSFDRKGIEQLPNDKPVVYKIQTEGGKTNYAGIAKRGRVQDRVEEHLPGSKDAIPGAKVVIEQTSSVAEAQAKEQRIIARSQPKYNDQGK